MFYYEIVIKACQNLKMKDEIRPSNADLRWEVGKIAHDEKKIQVINMSRQIAIVMNSRGDYFEKTGHGVYRLKDEPDSINKKEREDEYETLLELEKQLENLKLSEFERWAIIKQRIGQGAFRKTMLRKWGGCSVTGYGQSEILIASHIIPWSVSSKEQKLNENNGLLLLANIDKAFDQGLITFENDGNIRISDTLENPEDIGITQDMKLRKVFKGNEKFLEYHRNEIFEKQVTLDKENDIESDDNK